MHKQGCTAIAGLLLSLLPSLLGTPQDVALAHAPTNWIHTTYSNGVTAIAVAETTQERDNIYKTVVNGQPVLGWFRLSDIHHGKTHTDLSGVFEDICSGSIHIRRPNRQAGRPIVAEVTWVVTRQAVLSHRNRNNGDLSKPSACNVPLGQKFKLNLPEALPHPNKRGEFTNATSNTFLSEVYDFYAWPQWIVISADQVLNCRKQPNGAIQQTYRRGQIIRKLGREMLDGRSLIELPNGSAWLRTQQKCYVRASDRDLQPASLPMRNG